MKKTFLLNVVLSIATLISLFVIGRNFYDKMGFAKNQPARGEMRVVLASLKLEDSATKLKSQFADGQFQHLKLDTRNPSLWSVNTPIEFGSKNWTLFLEFDAKSDLAAIRLRTPDGLDIRPRDINFPDRVRPNWISPINKRWK